MVADPTAEMNDALCAHCTQLRRPPAAAVTTDVFHDVLQKLPKGSRPAGPCGWMYEHKAGAVKDCDARSVALRFLTILFDRQLPHLSEIQHAHRLGEAWRQRHAVHRLGVAAAGLCSVDVQAASPPLGHGGGARARRSR